MSIENNLAQASRFTVSGFQFHPQWSDHGTVLEVCVTTPDRERYAMSERMWEPAKGKKRIEFVRTKEQVCAQMARWISDAVQVAPAVTDNLQ